MVFSSPIGKLNLDGIIVLLWAGLRGTSSESDESDVFASSEGESCWEISSGLYWISRLTSEFVSRSQIAAGVRVLE